MGQQTSVIWLNSIPGKLHVIKYWKPLQWPRQVRAVSLKRFRGTCFPYWRADNFQSQPKWTNLDDREASVQKAHQTCARTVEKVYFSIFHCGTLESRIHGCSQWSRGRARR